MAKRVTICPGDLPLRALLSSTADVTHQTFASRSSEDVAERSAQALKAGHAHVEPASFPVPFLQELVMRQTRFFAMPAHQVHSSNPLLQLSTNSGRH